MGSDLAGWQHPHFFPPPDPQRRCFHGVFFGATKSRNLTHRQLVSVCVWLCFYVCENRYLPPLFHFRLFPLTSYWEKKNKNVSRNCSSIFLITHRRWLAAGGLLPTRWTGSGLTRWVSARGASQYLLHFQVFLQTLDATRLLNTDYWSLIDTDNASLIVIINCLFILTGRQFCKVRFCSHVRPGRPYQEECQDFIPSTRKNSQTGREIVEAALWEHSCSDCIQNS